MLDGACRTPPCRRAYVLDAQARRARQACAIRRSPPAFTLLEYKRPHQSKAGVGVLQDLINFLYTIRGEMFYWALMGLVLVWICDLFGLWNRWGKRD